jgi:hypothetical protein
MSIYSPLPILEGKPLIRLLKIVPDLHTDHFRCSCAVFELKSAPQFCALSYEWGPPSPARTISVNGQEVLIRSNLWNFLRQLRQHGTNEHLWCDAICINQESNRERSHQVQLMTQIYRTAHSVLVWLGEGQNRAVRIIRDLRLLSSSWGTHPIERSEILRGLADIAKESYWTRIWIVQEITVAQRIELFYGNESIPWTIFAEACKFPADFSNPWVAKLWAHYPPSKPSLQLQRVEVGGEIGGSIMYQLIRSQKRWPSFPDSFETLSQRYADSNCHDSRDRVFGLLGISSDVKAQRVFSIDYDRSIEDTYFDFVSWVFKKWIKTSDPLGLVRLIMNSMKLEWVMMDFNFDKYQKTRLFSNWIHQPLEIRVSCFHARHISWDSCTLVAPFTETWTSISSGELYSEVVYKTQDASSPVGGRGKQGHDTRRIQHLDCDIFRISQSSISLLCYQLQDKSWAVIDEASVNHHEIVLLQNFAELNSGKGLFEGLIINSNKGSDFTVDIKNRAQFMQIMLNYQSPGKRPSFLTSVVGGAAGAGSLQRERGVQNRDLEDAVEQKIIGSAISLTSINANRRYEIKEEKKESLIEKSHREDLMALEAESEQLARPKDLSLRQYSGATAGCHSEYANTLSSLEDTNTLFSLTDVSTLLPAEHANTFLTPDIGDTFFNSNDGNTSLTSNNGGSYLQQQRWQQSSPLRGYQYSVLL